MQLQGRAKALFTSLGRAQLVVKEQSELIDSCGGCLLYDEICTSIQIHCANPATDGGISTTSEQQENDDGRISRHHRPRREGARII